MKGTIFFDWDGTLHDTKHLYGEAVRGAVSEAENEGIRYHGRKGLTDSDLSIYLGMSPPDMWKDFWPELDRKTACRISRRIGELMDINIHEGNARLYSNTENILKLLSKEYELAILSNCRHEYMEAHKLFFNLDRFFSAYYCGEDFGFISKDKILSEVITRHSGKYYMVGDRRDDIDAGIKNRIYTIGCSYGFGEQIELEAADEIITDISDILKIV